MGLRRRIKVAMSGLLICALALPAAFIITITTFPLWRWFESASGIESFGHSGPADWCYWLVYGVVVTVASIIWWRLDRSSTGEE